LLIVAAQSVLSIAFFLLAIAGSGSAVLLAVLVLDFLILVVPWHFLQPDSVKRIDRPPRPLRYRSGSGLAVAASVLVG
jgi:cell division protein FtsW (lipid II flippase)